VTPVKTMRSTRIGVSSFKFLNLIKVSVAPVSNKKLVFSRFAFCMGKVTKSKPVFAREFLCICVTLYSRANCDVLVFDTFSSSSLLLNEESKLSLRFFYFFTKTVVYSYGFLILFGLCWRSCIFSGRPTFFLAVSGLLAMCTIFFHRIHFDVFIRFRQRKSV